jgi:hypothetical protein
VKGRVTTVGAVALVPRVAMLWVPDSEYGQRAVAVVFVCSEALTVKGSESPPPHPVRSAVHRTLVTDTSRA